MDVGEILSKSWQIVWKHKVLWIFGIFAGCSSGGGNAGNARTSYQGNVPPNVERFFEQIPTEIWVFIIAAVALFILLVILITAFLSTMGRIGVIYGSVQADEGIEKLTFSEIFKASLPYFWRVFLVNFIFGILVAMLIISIIILFIVGGIATFGIGLLCLIPTICLLIPIFWAATIIIEQSTIAIVVEDLSITEGIKRGWEVVTQNIGSILIMWLILGLGVSTFGGLLISLPVILVFVPTIVGVIAGSSEAMGIGILLSILFFLAYLPIWIFLNGILRTYYETGWTLTFRRITLSSNTTQDESDSAASA